MESLYSPSDEKKFFLFLKFDFLFWFIYFYLFEPLDFIAWPKS
ncbi:Hypothetical protein Minf_1343 [Methylacidiphilum infernorum V4]|uniref:Uncharacterized protein n=1 Tax=Methylacidiphilum infernorum (isolate V4) TaxID=481448 RepID=B3DVP4_METI4|nr:Hypothetical protein Minf_1343 [Methylacidiphilum infernorum V4]